MEYEGNELQDLMAEPPGGHNYGRSPKNEIHSEGWKRSLDTEQREADELLFTGGYSVVWPGHGGTVSFSKNGRDVIPDDEYVDQDKLKDLVEDALSATYAEIKLVYSARYLKADMRQRRDEIDSRLLALSRSGGNMSLLARLVGMNQRTLERALARAREAEKA